MLITIAVVLVILYILGFLGVYSIGWAAYIFLVIAGILVVIRFLEGKEPFK